MNFPIELSNYIKFLEKELHVPISIISVGPKDRKLLLDNYVLYCKNYRSKFDENLFNINFYIHLLLFVSMIFLAK